VVLAGQWRGFAVWFAIAIVGHDLLLFPLYSLADLSVRRLLPLAGRIGRRRPRGAGEAGAAGAPAAGRLGPPVLTYLRVPAAFSLLILLVWFPLILRLSAGTYHRASGLSASPYLGRWLAVTGTLFAGSAICYALALRRARPGGTARPPAPRGTGAAAGTDGAESRLK
jgi:hypothetical protein